MGMMVVVPSFSEGQKCHPEAISGGVSGWKPTRAPHMCGRVDKPGRVKIQDGAKKDAPKENRPSPQEQKDPTHYGHWYPMPLAEPDVKPVSAKVRDEGKEDRRVIMNALTRHDPAHMRP